MKLTVNLENITTMLGRLKPNIKGLLSSKKEEQCQTANSNDCVNSTHLGFSGNEKI